MGRLRTYAVEPQQTTDASLAEEAPTTETVKRPTVRHRPTNTIQLIAPSQLSPPQQPGAILNAQQRYGNRAVGQMLKGLPVIQRKCACGGCGSCREEDELRRRGIRRKAVGPVDRSADVFQDIARSKGGGQPLNSDTRSFMESRFGQDFSGVRIHNDSRANRLAQDLNAHAFTVGRNVYFAPGRYAPETTAGQRILAHELTHVVQQQNSSTLQRITVGQDGDIFEQEADNAAEKVVRGEPIHVQNFTGLRLSRQGLGQLRNRYHQFRMAHRSTQDTRYGVAAVLEVIDGSGQQITVTEGVFNFNTAEGLEGAARARLHAERQAMDRARSSLGNVQNGTMRMIVDSFPCSRCSPIVRQFARDFNLYECIWIAHLGQPPEDLLGPVPGGQIGIAVGYVRGSFNVLSGGAPGSRTRNISPQSIRLIPYRPRTGQSDPRCLNPAGTSGNIEDEDIEITFSPRSLRFQRPRNARAGRKVRIRVPRNVATSTIPGLNFQQASLDLGEDMRPTSGELTARATIPFLRRRNQTFTFSIDETGKAHVDFRANLRLGRLGDANLHVQSTENGGVTGQTSFTPRPSFLRNVRAEVNLNDGQITGGITFTPEALRPPVPGLTVDNVRGGLTFSSEVSRRGITGEIGGEAGATFRYRNLGELSLSIGYNSRQGLTVTGEPTVNLPGIAPVTGRVRYRNDRLTAEVQLTREHFPAGLPLERNTRVTVRWTDGRVEGNARGGVRLGFVGRGDLSFGYESGNVNLGATINLNVPGLRGSSITIRYREGQLEGDADIPINSDRLPSISGNLQVEYREGRFSGETRFSYRRGELSGTVTIRLEQLEDDSLAISGGGEVSAQIAPWLTGRVNVEITREAEINVQGEIRAPNEIELFPRREMRRERTFPRIDIPLWGFTVPVIRSYVGIVAFIEGGGGFVLFVGPGVLRNIGVTGSFSTQEGETPSFEISGEFFVPAGAEAYLFIGAGIALGVAIASVEGSIRLRGSLGAQASLSVIPQIGYADGNYYFRGSMELQALSYLRFSGAARAGISVPIIGEVWGEEWPLFDWVYPLGLNVALRGRMDYTFGRPFNPNFEFETADLDPKKIARAAVPGPGQSPRRGPSSSPQPRASLRTEPVPSARSATPGARRAAVPSRSASAARPAAPTGATRAIPRPPTPTPRRAPAPPARSPAPSTPSPSAARPVAGVGLREAVPAGRRVPAPARERSSTPERREPGQQPPRPPAPGSSTERRVERQQDRAGRQPISPDVPRRWQQGMQALNEVARRSRRNAFSQEEIESELARLRRQYRFRELRAERAGEDWRVYARMNPDNRDNPTLIEGVAEEEAAITDRQIEDIVEHSWTKLEHRNDFDRIGFDRSEVRELLEEIVNQEAPYSVRKATGRRSEVREFYWKELPDLIQREVKDSEGRQIKGIIVIVHKPYTIDPGSVYPASRAR